jgi:hypothetical protein
MADEKVLDALMGIFKSARYRPLSEREIANELRRRGFYREHSYGMTVAKVISHLTHTDGSNPSIYPFLEIPPRLWGLKTWFPSIVELPFVPQFSNEPLQKGWETQHKISVEGMELKEGAFILGEQRFHKLQSGLDETQKNFLVAVKCYAGDQVFCLLNHAYHRLESKGLQNWYVENNLRPGDVVWLTVEGIKPLVLRIYTAWDRDPDTYRLYLQERQIATKSHVTLTIRDLIWLYFIQKRKIAHRSEIAQAVLKDRPEVSEHSVDACLSSNLHLFTRTGEKGNWGLAEWGIGSDFVIRVKPSPSVPKVLAPIPESPVPLDYILVTIQGEDLVYKILKSSKSSLSGEELTTRVADYLGINKNILERTSFLNVNDFRLFRLHDGTFQLRENLEEIIGQYKKRIDDLEQSLDTAGKSTESLEHELSNFVSLSIKREQERDEALGNVQQIRDQLTQSQQEFEKRISKLASQHGEEIASFQVRIREIEDKLRDACEQAGLREQLFRDELAQAQQKSAEQIANLDAQYKLELAQLRDQVEQMEHERDQARRFARDYFAKWPRNDGVPGQIDDERQQARRFALQWFAVDSQKT